MTSRNNDPARDARIASLYAAGLTTTEIAREVGFTVGGVSRALRRLGVPLRPVINTGRKPIHDDAIRTLREAGKTQREIAAAVGRHPTSVHARLKAMGLTRHHLPPDDGQIRALFEAGHKRAEIVRRTGASAHTVRTALRRLGLVKDA